MRQTNILEYLEQTVLRVPDKVAFSNEEMGLTFRQVYDQSRSVGSFLHAQGLYKKPIVVFMKKHLRIILLLQKKFRVLIYWYVKVCLLMM